MEILSYSFIQNALLGGLLASLLCAMVGTYVVTRRLVIAGGGVAHASLGGVGLGAYFGFSPLLGAAAFALFSGYSIEWLSRRHGAREDSATAMLWTFGMSIGILFSFLAPGFMTELPAYLFGDILSISHSDLITIGLLTALTALLFYFFLPIIVSISYDRDFAITQGLPVRFFEFILTTLTALTIVSCLHIVGIVLVISLLSIPQMTAAIFVRTFRSMVFLSALLGYAGCLCGLVVSFYFNVPSGAAIILASVSIYILSRAIKKLHLRFFCSP